MAAAALWELKSVGVEIAIDDFGTGYSSLSRLHEFPLDYLKIDRRFVDGMMERSEDAIIVPSVLGLAHGLGIQTIAEGIEGQAQWDELAAAGCHLGQGWLWSPAVSLDKATELVARTGSLSTAAPAWRCDADTPADTGIGTAGSCPAGTGAPRSVGCPAPLSSPRQVHWRDCSHLPAGRWCRPAWARR